MPSLKLSLTSSLGCLAAVALALLAAPACAQAPAAPAKSAPALDADAFRLPPSAYDAGKFDYTPPKTDTGGFQPGRFQLGTSILQLDTKRQEPSNRVGIEAVDPKLLGGISKDDSSPLPNYFGMTLSKPLN
jgi:hypothetical protein